MNDESQTDIQSESHSDYKKIIVSTGLSCVGIGILMTFKDLPVIVGVEAIEYYLLGRIFLLGMFMFPVASVLLGYSVSYYPVYFYISVTLYAIHGQLFQSNYWLALLELNALFPTFFPIRRKVLLFLYIFGVVAFNIVFVLTSKKYIALGLLTQPLVADIIAATVITTILAIVFYNSYYSLKMYKNKMDTRFADVGKTFSFLMHDLKGMISSQVSYAALLKKWLEQHKFSEKEEEVLNYLVGDIESLKTMVTDVNQFVRSEFALEKNIACVSEAVRHAKMILSSKLKNVVITQIGEVYIQTSPHFLTRLFLNVFQNSGDEFKSKNIQNGEITVQCNSDGFHISDNTQAVIDRKILDSLNSPYFSSSKKGGGSGMGTFSIKDYVNSSGGKVVFKNESSGLVIHVRFPKKLICELPLGPLGGQNFSSPTKELS